MKIIIMTCLKRPKKQVIWGLLLNKLNACLEMLSVRMKRLQRVVLSHTVNKMSACREMLHAKLERPEMVVNEID